MSRSLTVTIARDGSGYVATCPALEVVSPGDSISEARNNIKAALELYFGAATLGEINGGIKDEVYVRQVEVTAA